MTLYGSCMTMLSVRVDDDVAGQIESWCSQHEMPRSDFLREAVRRELNRRHAVDEAAWIDTLDDDLETASAFEAIEAWGPQEDWSQWHAWLDAAEAAELGSSRAGDDPAG